MKIVLVQPRGRSVYDVCPEPPLGLAYLAAALLEYKNDLDIEIIDGFLFDSDEHYYKKISEIDADVVGVTTILTLLPEALKIPALVKNRNAEFIMGGPGASNLTSSRIYESGYSIICFGEGERTIVELIKAFEDSSPLKAVHGISFQQGGKEVKTPPRAPIENLDEIPFPARDLLDMKKYLSIWKEKMGVAATQIISSRGCPFSCRFCSKEVFGRRARYASPARAVEEMGLIYDRYKAEIIFFANDLFTANKKWVIDFCDAMNERLPGKMWGAQARVGTVDLEMLSRMRRAGCTELMFGVESGSQRILDFLGKGLTVEEIRRTFKLVNEAGINAGIYLIVGVPGERQEDIDETKRLIAELKPKAIDIYFLTPIPGTEIFEMTKSMIRDDAEFFNFNESFESVYRKEVFEVEPREMRREIMDFFSVTTNNKRNALDRPFIYKYDETVEAN
ncbi:MAG TPA: radical SAM protein [Methanothrix sp.]|nr:radical SAM protein [Methanothrix sp.]